MDKDQIKKRFKWDDNKSYKWIIKTPGNSKISAFFTLLIYIIIPTIVYLIFYLIGLLSQKTAFYIAFVLFILWFGYVVLSLLSIYTGDQAMKNKSRAYLRTQSFVFVALIAYVLSSPVSFWSQSFIMIPNINPISVSDWMKYFIDNILSIVSIGIIDIFDFKLSTISPETWGAKAMVFLLNIVIVIGIVDAIIDAYSKRNDEIFIGTVQDLFYRCDNLAAGINYEVMLEGVYSQLESTESFLANTYKSAFIEEAQPNSPEEKSE
jgi:hypothetical protein